MRDLRIAGLRWIPVAVGLAAGTGCYSYLEVPADVVAPDDKIRVTMTRDEVMRQADLLESLDERLQATVMTNDAAAGLSLTFPDPNSSVSGPEFNRVIKIPWEGVVMVEGRTFSWPRTIGMVAIGTVVAVSAAAVVTGGFQGSRGSEGGGDPNADRGVPRPVFRIPVPFSF